MTSAVVGVYVTPQRLVVARAALALHLTQAVAVELLLQVLLDEVKVLVRQLLNKHVDGGVRSFVVVVMEAQHQLRRIGQPHFDRITRLRRCNTPNHHSLTVMHHITHLLHARWP